MNLKRVRIRNGMTQQQLADQAGITQVYLAQLEGSEKNPPVRRASLRALNALARALGVDVADLVGEKRGPKPACPLCGRAADVAPLRDRPVLLVHCPSCRTFRIEEKLAWRAHHGLRARRSTVFADWAASAKKAAAKGAIKEFAEADLNEADDR